MRKIILAIAMLLATVGIGVANVAPASATVSTSCSSTWYYTGSDSHAYKLYVQCAAGTAKNGFEAIITCIHSGQYYGVSGNYQVNPGPWYGSTATCNSGDRATGGNISFF